MLLPYQDPKDSLYAAPALKSQKSFADLHASRVRPKADHYSELVQGCPALKNSASLRSLGVGTRNYVTSHQSSKLEKSGVQFQNQSLQVSEQHQ